MTTQLVLIDVQFVSLLTQEKAACATAHLFLLDVEFASLYMQGFS